MAKTLRSQKSDEYIRFKPYQAVGVPTTQPQKHEVIGLIVVAVAVVVVIMIAGIVVWQRH